MSLRPNARTEARRSRYKVAVDSDDGRRRREENTVVIRKIKREESLLKKQRQGLQPQQLHNSSTAAPHIAKKTVFEVKKEAAWAISNAASGGSPAQIKFLVSEGCIKPLCDLLACPDPIIVTVCLEGLEDILKIGEAEKDADGVNKFGELIEEAGGLEKIEKLQSHDNHDIYDMAVKILGAYWLDEVEEQLPSGDAPKSGFNFGGGDFSVPSGGFKFS